MVQDITAMLWQNAMRGLGESYQQGPAPASITPEDVSSKFTKGKVGQDTNSAPGSGGDPNSQSFSGQQINLGNSGNSGYQSLTQQSVSGGITAGRGG